MHMYLHVTGTIPDANKLAPYLDEERRVAAELQTEGILKQIYRCRHSPGVFIIIEANDLDDAHKKMARLPLVAGGLLTLEFVEVEGT
jgi:muconolactone delta-isomerase